MVNAMEISRKSNQHKTLFRRSQRTIEAEANKLIGSIASTWEEKIPVVLVSSKIYRIVT